jgi:multidrug resistance efflux pump
MNRQPALMDPRTARPAAPPPPAPRLIPWSLIWFAVLVLTVGAVVAWFSVNPPSGLSALLNVASPSANDKVSGTSNGSTAGTKLDGRAVAISHVDVEQGVTQLYPVRPGRVVKVYVKEGDEVQERAPLLKVDDELAKIQLAEARTALEAARKGKEKAEMLVRQHQKGIQAQQAKVDARKKTAEKARVAVKKARQMYQDRAGATKEDVDLAQKSVEEAEFGVRAEEAELERIRDANPSLAVELAELDIQAKQEQVDKAELGVRECILRAPELGMVLRRFVNEGETLGSNPQRPAIEFAAGERIIRAEVEQEFASKVRVGMKAHIQDYETVSDTYWEGEVVRVSPFVLPRRHKVYEPMQFNDVRTLEAIIRLKSDVINKLKIGQRMRVLLEQ